MNEFGFSISMDILGQTLGFGLLAFAVVGMSIEKLMKKINAPQMARRLAVTLVALAILVPIVVFMIYTPFSGVKVANDHIEIQYLFPRFSDNISYSDLSSVDVVTEIQPTKMSSFSTDTLVLTTRDQRSLRSFDTRNQGSGPSPAAQAKLAITKAQENSTTGK